MTIVKIYGGKVALCRLHEPYTKRIANMDMVIDRAVCALDNLVADDAQLFINFE